MKALTSHRDEIFKKWVVDFLIEMGKKPTQFYFDYIDIRLMQRGDTTPESQAWLKENKNEVFKKIHKVLLPKDYLRFRLSGAYVTDMSDASGTLWLNVKKRNWSER